MNTQKQMVVDNNIKPTHQHDEVDFNSTHNTVIALLSKDHSIWSQISENSMAGIKETDQDSTLFNKISIENLQRLCKHAPWVG
jgi:hypothetical protein